MNNDEQQRITGAVIDGAMDMISDLPGDCYELKRAHAKTLREVAARMEVAAALAEELV